jgi:adenine-specific DNA-methyltransferase
MACLKELFKGVTASSCVLIFGTDGNQESALFFDFRKHDRKSLPNLLQEEAFGQDASNVGKDSEGNILQIRHAASLVDKCNRWPALREIAEDVATGVSSGLDKAYVFTSAEVRKFNLEDDLLKKLIIGGEIGRYWLHPVSGKKIIYITPINDIEDYPHIKSTLLPHSEQLKLRREAANGKIPWYSLNWPRIGPDERSYLSNPKFLLDKRPIILWLALMVMDGIA